MASPFVLVTPSTRGLSLALTRHFLRSTHLPVFATYRSGPPANVHKHILSPLPDIDPTRLTLIHLDLASEPSIQSAASNLAGQLPVRSYLHTGFFTGGILKPERQPSDLDLAALQNTFQINVISHLLLIKHFSRFLPSTSQVEHPPAKWVHVSARVGSISDNRKGGWYSYRASKAALNQVIKTFDNQLQMRKTPAICVGVHPGTVRTDLSRDFWGSVPENQLFDADEAAHMLGKVVSKLSVQERGRVWDYAGKEVPW